LRRWRGPSTTFIVDLDSGTCGSDPLEALEYMKGEDVIFRVHRSSPLLPLLLEGMEVVGVEGEQVSLRFKDG